MPTATEDDEAKGSAAKTSIEVKQLQRYYTVLRDFMANFHSKDEIYPPNHEFTQDELSAVAPEDIIKWMNVKLYNKEDPDEEDRPVNGSHHTLDYYKKSISYFMPKKEAGWDAATKTGNPTRAHEINNLIKKIKQFDEDAGGAKKRKSTAKSSAEKKSRSSLPANFAPNFPQPGGPAASAASGPAMAMQGILRRIHSQNSSFIELFGTLSYSLEQFKSTLQANNQAIMVEMSNLNRMSVPMQSYGNQFQMAPLTGRGMGMSQPVSTPKTNVGTAMLDWQYVHADGVRRRVPPTWHFPHLSLQEMYILWHVGDYQNRISPMKLFEQTDINFLGKRAKTNLGEVKSLMNAIDEKAKSKGKPVKTTMTLNEATVSFNAGLDGLDFNSTTPTGKQRNIARLKWSTLTKHKLYGTPKAKKAIASPKVSKQFVEASEDDTPENWKFKHNDGIERRVPSTWQFPMLGIQDMYVYWHCGDAEHKIPPMKLLGKGDVTFKKGLKENLSECRTIMTLIDLEAQKKGMAVKTVTTPAEATNLVTCGITGIEIPPKADGTPEKETLSLSWKYIAEHRKKSSDAQDDEEADDDSDDEEAAEEDEPMEAEDAEEVLDAELPEAEMDV